MSDHAVRVLVVDDSPTARALLVGMLTSDPGITVAGEAADGTEAIRLTQRLRPDVITMDVHMPRMDGLKATREIMMSTPTPIIVVTANTQPGDVEMSLDATAAGALMLIEKPVGPHSPAFEWQRRHLLSMVRAMAGVKVVRRWGTGNTPTSNVVTSAVSDRSAAALPRVLAIGASTGGPACIQQMLQQLGGGFPAPILLVQHIANGFTPGFVHWLQQSAGMRVQIAAHGEPLRKNTVYVAPDDRHIGVQDEHRIALSDAAPIQGFRPSATFLYESVARVFGRHGAAVILTGMGADGVAGLKLLHGAGGTVLAQDEASSVVWGMPREAVRAGVVHFVGNVAAIAGRLREIASMENST